MTKTEDFMNKNHLIRATAKSRPSLKPSNFKFPMSIVQWISYPSFLRQKNPKNLVNWDFLPNFVWTHLELLTFPQTQATTASDREMLSLEDLWFSDIGKLRGFFS